MARQAACIGMFTREEFYIGAPPASPLNLPASRSRVSARGDPFFPTHSPFPIPVINFIELLAAFLALVTPATTRNTYGASCIFAKSPASGFRLEKLKHDSWLSPRVRRDVVFLRVRRALACKTIDFRVCREEERRERRGGEEKCVPRSAIPLTTKLNGSAAAERISDGASEICCVRRQHVFAFPFAVV